MRILLTILFLTAFGTLTQGVDFEDKYNIHGRLRHLRSVGFEHLDTASISEINTNTGKLSSVNHAKIRSRRSTDEPTDLYLSVKLDNSNRQFHLQLRHEKPVLHPNAKILLRRGEEQIIKEPVDVNCILTHQQGQPFAVISFCEKTRGLFTHDGHEYAIETVEEDDKGSARIYIAKRKPLNENYVNDAAMVFEKVIRNKRSAVLVKRPDHFEIETALIVDSDMTNYLKFLGLTQFDQWLEYMLIKWTGVQALWSDSKYIGYKVTIQLKHVEIWEQDPAWYTSLNTTTQSTKMVCNHAHENKWSYDHVSLQMGRTDGLPFGMSWVGGICIGKWKCSVVRSRDNFAAKGVAHEIGHNLGLSHNSAEKNNCGNGDGGMMGDLPREGLSTCSREKLNSTISKSPRYDCLFRQDVDEKDFELDTAYSGQNMLPDELCEVKYGKGLKYLPDPTCRTYSCMYMEGSRRGVTINLRLPPRGISCGQQKMCIHNTCKKWTETRRNVTQLKLDMVEGGWSGYSDWSICSRSCGTGVKTASRVCNNPKPINSPVCAGLAFKTKLCNEQPCEGDTEMVSSLEILRASEVCQQRIKDGWLKGTLFSGRGSYWPWWHPLGTKSRCIVGCLVNNGNAANNLFGWGIMPDGTPCDEPSNTGHSFRCAQGQCLEFGCDGALLSEGGFDMDKCFVCNGKGETCKVIEGNFTEPGSSRKRLHVITAPTGAHHIEVKIENYENQKWTSIELWSKDGTVVLSRSLLKDHYLTKYPAYFAGAFWYYRYNIGLWTTDKINQPVVVKLFIGSSQLNKKITFKYIVPDNIVETCKGTCENGGKWENCSCTCPKGFYGLTCNSKCNTVCRNGEAPDASSCECNCGEKMYGTNYCTCKAPFMGQLCNTCTIPSCKNCGQFNQDTCRCKCPDGYGGLDCKDKCENKATDCDTRQCDGSSTMERDCMVKCQLCIVETCKGTCENGGKWENCSCTCPKGFYGLTCNSKCNTVCRNGEAPDASSCECNCGEKMYGTNYCTCKAPFMGQLCNTCTIPSCKNCGQFNQDTCRCKCPDGYGGLDCKDKCENKATDCDTRQCDGSYEMERDCMVKCQLCTPQVNATLPVC